MIRHTGAFSLFLAFLWPMAGEAREWTSRTGTSTVEAELIDVEGDLLVLKRSDGKLFKVPLSKLSLGDVKYAREAMEAAGIRPEPPAIDAPAANAPAASEAPAKAPLKPNAAAPAAAATEQPLLDEAARERLETAPLANPASSRWQVSVDPPDVALAVASDELRIAAPDVHSYGGAFFPASPSPYLALVGGAITGDSEIELWDLKRGKQIVKHKAGALAIRSMTLNPAGTLLAYQTSQSRGKIDVYSLNEGKIVRQIEFGQQYASATVLTFAGNRRLLAAETSGKSCGIWNVETGLRFAELIPPSSSIYNGNAISAGGTYMAFNASNNKIALYDTRNGAAAGELEIPKENGRAASSSRRTIAFSPDGREFAAIVEHSEGKYLYCWSLASGELVASHALNDQLPRPATSIKVNTREIDWIPGDKGWLLYNTAIVDRVSGGPVWVAGDSRSILSSEARIVIDEKRMLRISGRREGREITVEPIPWDKINESKQLVEAGGKPSDLGLPPLSVADRSALGQPAAELPNSDPLPALSPATFPEAGSVVLPIDCQLVELASVSADGKQITISGRPAQSTAPVGQEGKIVDTFDLATGQRTSHFKWSNPGRLIDVGPAGRLGVFVNGQEQDRLDIYELGSGKHVVGFRPAKDSNSTSERRIAAARLVDDQSLIVQTMNKECLLWEIPTCRAIRPITAGFSDNLFLSRSRRYLAATQREGLRIVECLSGREVHSLQADADEKSLAIVYAAFRSDEAYIAALAIREDASRLIVWDLENNKVACDLALPFQSFAISWAGSDHVLLHQVDGLKANVAQGYRSVLVDVRQQRVVWNYKSPILTHILKEAPIDRLWYVTRNRLTAVALPEKKAGEIIAAAAEPAPVFGSRTRAVLDVALGGLPDDLPDRRAKEDGLAREINGHFEQLLKDRDVQISQDAPVTLHVSLRNVSQESIVRLQSRTRYGLGYGAPTSSLVLTSTTIHGLIELKTAAGQTLWSQEKLFPATDVRPADVPDGMTLATHVRLEQWKAGRAWCLETPLPKSLYAADAYRGVGESALEDGGTRFIRAYGKNPLDQDDESTRKAI